MKKIVIILLLLPLISISQSSSEYYDAIELSKLITFSTDSVIYFTPKDSSNHKAAKILSKYVSGRNFPQIANEIESNPFIRLAPDTSQGTFPDIKSGDKISISSLGGLNVTDVADGLAKFLVQRTKQELSITFFNEFTNKLKAQKELQELFPNTYASLLVMEKEIYKFTNYLNLLREAFDKDLQDMLNNLEDFAESRKNSLFQTNDSESIKKGMKYEYFETALMIVNSLRSGEHPADIVGSISGEVFHDNNDGLKNLQEASKLFSIFSESLRSTDPDRYWISSSELKELTNLRTFNIYLGLLYQSHGNDLIFNKEFKTYLKEINGVEREIKKYISYTQQLISKADDFNLALKRLNKEKEDGEVTSYKDLFDSMLSFVEHLNKAKDVNIAFTIPNGDEIVKVLNYSNDIYLNISEKEYNALVLNVSNLFTVLLDENNFLWKEDLIKYGTFMANIAQAQNSEEVMSAIESIALPVGSASIKKKSQKNTSLNAYLGLSGGAEYNGDLGQFKSMFALNAPVGIAFSKGRYEKKSDGTYKEKGSRTWFLSLIDIGAVTTFRFGDSDTEKLPEIKLENIVSPGLYYVKGHKYWPISWGFGAQLGPQLREITIDNTDKKTGPTLSFRVFVAVDIPLLNFYTKSR